MSDQEQKLTEQNYSRWFTHYPNTHTRAGQTVEVMPVADYQRDAEQSVTVGELGEGGTECIRIELREVSALLEAAEQIADGLVAVCEHAYDHDGRTKEALAAANQAAVLIGHARIAAEKRCVVLSPQTKSYRSGEDAP